jgi:RNA polymerase sigma-70 factor (sigma-E family)
LSRQRRVTIGGVVVTRSEAVDVDDDAAPSAPGLSFDDFVASRSPALWRSAYLLTGDRHKAEDLLQIALVKTWRRWPRIARDGAVEGYVRRVLVTTYTDWWRRRWNAEVPAARLPDLPTESGPDSPEVAAIRHDVLAALARLSRGQRAVIVLRYFDDLTEQQTATALGCSVGTVKSQTSRAMAALRSSPLLARDDEDGAGT